MSKPKLPKDEAPPDPDQLVREAGGGYRTADGRFEVSQSGPTWFLIDSQQANEFGQELMHGPFATLKEVRAQLPGVRAVKARSPVRPSRARAKSAKKAPPPPPPSWIDRLPAADATEVRRLIRALEHEGIEAAEDLVRADREASEPMIAARLLERRLAALIEESPEAGRANARTLLRQIADVVGSEGATVRRRLPGWALVELDADGKPTNRRIRLRP
jgi:hypothetical protein